MMIDVGFKPFLAGSHHVDPGHAGAVLCWSTLLCVSLEGLEARQVHIFDVMLSFHVIASIFHVCGRVQVRNGFLGGSWYIHRLLRVSRKCDSNVNHWWRFDAVL